jgi:hypothetical protein
LVDGVGVGGVGLRKGSTQTLMTRRRQSLAKLDPAVLLAEDAETLRSIGPVNRFTFAERAKCSERIAHTRLTRLVDAGLATRFKPRGAAAFTYTTPD